MPKLSMVLVVVFFFTLSCKKSSNFAYANGVCGVKDPMTNLPWLKEKIDSMRAERLSGQVKRFRYNGQDIISIQAWIQSCYPCNLYSCSGRLLTHDDNQDVFDAVMNNLNALVVIGEF